MDGVNKIVFTQRDFGQELYIKVAEQLKLLLLTKHICTVYEADEGRGTVVIEYVSENPAMGEPYPFHLYSDEIEAMNQIRTISEIEKYKRTLQQEGYVITHKDDKENTTIC